MRDHFDQGWYYSPSVKFVNSPVEVNEGCRGFVIFMKLYAGERMGGLS